MSNKRTKPAKRRSSRQKPVKQIAGHIVGLDDERSDPISRETPIKVARYRLLSNHQVPVGQRQLLATQLGKVQGNSFFRAELLRTRLSKPGNLPIQRRSTPAWVRATRLDIPPQEVMYRVAYLMQNADPVTVDGNQFIPGQYYNFPGQGKILIVWPTTTNIVFAKGYALYEQGTTAFIRNMYLDAMAEGARQAEGMVVLAKAEMDFIMGLGPAWATVPVSVLKGLVWYQQHRQTIAHASKWAGVIVEIHNLLKDRFPHTYDFIWQQLIYTIVTDFSFDFALEDSAKALGQLLRSLGATPFKTVSNTLWGVISKLTIFLAKVATNAAKRGTTGNTKAHAQRLAQDLEQIGIAVRERDVEQLMKELSNPEVIELLARLQQGFHALSQDLEKLAESS